MVWMLAIPVAMSIASSMQAAEQQQKQFEAQATITNANALAGKDVRNANNTFQAAQAALQNSERSIGNQERMRAFGDQYNALETNQTRIMDNMARGRLSTQLKAASNLGALRAESVSRGVGGSSAAIMRSVANLASGHTETQAADNMRYVNYDTLLQKSGLMRSAVNSLDFGQSLPQFDYGINAQSPINPHDYMNTTSAAVIGALSKNMGSLMTMAGSFGKGSTWIDGSKVTQASLGNTINSSAMDTTSSYFNMA